MSAESVLHWAAQSHSGSRKPRNDDSLIIFASDLHGAAALPASGNHPLAKHDMVFAVSDGMGGGNAGDLASKTLLEKLSEAIPETFKLAASGLYPDCLQHLNEAIRAVHDHLNEIGTTEETRGMAATLALAWFTPENVYLGNVGDSRIYHSRHGILQQLSRDHTAAFGQWKRGEITEFQYRSHPRRAALYEVIGGDHKTVCPHLAALPYMPGDRLLICSDGLIDGVWERHIAETLSEAVTVEDAASNLLSRAVENSGIDDASLIVIEVRDA